MPLLSSHSAGEVATDLTRSNATTAVDNVTTLPGRLHGGLEEVRLRLPAKEMAGVLPQFVHPENHIRGTGTCKITGPTVRPDLARLFSIKKPRVLPTLLATF